MRVDSLIEVAQMISRDDAERYEIITGRKAPWTDRPGYGTGGRHPVRK